MAKQHGSWMGKVTAPQYNELVTMHGTIMVFFVAMPVLLGAFGNFLIPLMIGARDMAFPRLNLASFWTFFFGSMLLLMSFFVPGGASRAGWTNYVPLSDLPSYTGGVYWGGNLWLMALAIDFASVLMGGINFLTTAIAMRAPGMTMGRMPLMVWQELLASVLFMLSVGPLIAGVVMLLLDRMAGTGFSCRTKALTRCCGSICSGSSAIPRSTWWRCRGWESCRKYCPSSRASQSSAIT